MTHQAKSSIKRRFGVTVCEWRYSTEPKRFFIPPAPVSPWPFPRVETSAQASIFGISLARKKLEQAERARLVGQYWLRQFRHTPPNCADRLLDISGNFRVTTRK